MKKTKKNIVVNPKITKEGNPQVAMTSDSIRQPKPSMTPKKGK